jgi:thiosulfate/3-mercaptopyruvate sulfurtransferase
MVKSKNDIDENIKLKNFKVVDARSYERFKGIVPELRINVKSGSIKGSYCLPFSKIINKNNNTFKNNADLNQIFKEVIDTEDNNIVFSCGSGVTASVLALAYSLINNKYTPTIYDGSWSEYGLIK